VTDRHYLAVWGALMVLLGATVGVNYLDLGRFGLIAALGIASAKTLLVLAYFMHLKGDERLLWLAAASGFVWLAILIVGVLDELAYRSFLN
jgi:cytochrome c oxidase subunit IV